MTGAPLTVYFYYRAAPTPGQVLGQLLRLKVRSCPNPDVARVCLEGVLGQVVSWVDA